MAGTASSRGRPARSAFAAAFLSFVFPGLGQAYLGRWRRALLWALLPVMGLAAAGAVLANEDPVDLLSRLVEPEMLAAALGLVIVDLLYRLASVIDAWRLGRDGSIGTRTTASLSTLGVLLVTIVLVASHLAVAQPILLAQDVLATFDGKGGDTSAIPDVGALDPDVQALINAQVPSTAPGSAGPTTPTATQTPAPTFEPWTGKERLDILLVGIDSGRPGEATFLTDTMMVVSIDPVSGKLALISLPRDTVGVPLPEEWTKARAVYGSRYAGRINSLYIVARTRPDLFRGNDRQRGYRALMGALSELYGLDIEHYISVDLKGFRGAVNALGGIVVDVHTPLIDPGYPADDGGGHLKLYVAPGMQRMNGRDALAYARSRKTTSDFARTQRQQHLVESMQDQLGLDTLLEPGVLMGLFAEYREHVTTNIPASMLPRLASLATDLDLSRPKSLVLSPQKGYTVEQADYDLVPNISKIRRAVKSVFNSGAKKAPLASSSP